MGPCRRRRDGEAFGFPSAVTPEPPQSPERWSPEQPATGSAARRSEPPGQHRWEFVRAFIDNSWTRPGAERAVARPHIILLVATVAAAVALGAGVVLQLVWPVELAKATTSDGAASATDGFTAVAGWDCVATATSGFEAIGRQAGWLTIAEGGWAQDGCHGTFEVMPLAGKATAEVGGQSAVWWFSPGLVGRCEVMVYVPRADPAKYRATPTAQFEVMAGRGGQAFAQFVLDQSARAGSWVTVGAYPVSRTGIAVRMLNRGEPQTPDTKLAITQVKVECK